MPGLSHLRPAYRRWPLLAILLLLALLFLGRGTVVLHPRSLQGLDQTEYLIPAWNLANQGTLSTRRGLEGVRPPSAWREPGYSVLLAGGMAWVPRTATVRATTPAEFEDYAQQDLAFLKWLQWLLLGAMALGLGWLTAHLSGRPWLGLATGTALAFGPTLALQANAFQSENLAMPLLLAASAALWRAARHPAALWGWLLAGALLGLLTLVKAAFQFLPLLLALGLLVVAWRSTAAAPARWAALRHSTALRAAIALAAAWLVVVAPWLARNAVHFGQPFVAERGGLQLITRAAFNGLDVRSHAAGFFYFTPNPSVNSWSRDLLGGQATRGLEQHRARSYFIGSNRRYYALRKSTGNPAVTDRLLTREGVLDIMTHPLGHLSATLPLAWRGLFFGLSHLSPETNDFYGARRPGLEWQAAGWRNLWHLGWVGDVLLFAAFVWMLLRSLRRVDWPLLSLLAPSAYLFTLDTLLTQNLPRFNQPMLPLLYLAAALAVQAMWHAGCGWRHRRASAARQGRTPS